MRLIKPALFKPFPTTGRVFNVYCCYLVRDSEVRTSDGLAGVRTPSSRNAMQCNAMQCNAMQYVNPLRAAPRFCPMQIFISGMCGPVARHGLQQRIARHAILKLWGRLIMKVLCAALMSTGSPVFRCLR
jgi:hypothetical protein